MNAHYTMWHIAHTFTTSKIVCVAIHVGGMFAGKAKIGVSTHVPCYDSLFKSKNMKRSICKTLWFCYGDKKPVCGWQDEFGVMPILLDHDVWPIQIGAYLTMLEASILQNGGFEVTRFGKYHVIQ